MVKLTISKQFLKDLKKVKLNQTNAEKLFNYVSLLLHEKELPPEAKNHPLIGNWKDTMKFHISGDLIVIYRKDKKLKEIQLIRIGTHSQLFK